MESSNINCQMCVRKVIQDVLKLVWFKQGVIPEKPSLELSFVPEISAEIIDNLCNSVWIESYNNVFIWEDFLKTHFKRMKTTPYLFANYVAYACYLSHQSSGDIHESFFYTLSLVNHFVLYCWQEERKEFINTCVDLYCAFFEKEIRTKFEIEGGWQNFKHYLDKQESLIRYKELISANRPVHDLFKEFQNRHLESKEPYVIDNIILKNITDNQVETHQEAVAFAESIADKMRELCKKTFQDVLTDFAKTDRQVEELYRQTVGEATGGLSIEEGQVSSEEVREEALENIPSKSNSKKRNKRKEVKNPDALETTDLDILKSQDFGPASQESNLIPKLTEVKRAKKVLEGMLEDLTNISELIKFVCNENIIEAPIKVDGIASNS